MPAPDDPGGALGGALVAQAVLEELELPFCFIGGLVVSRWGEQRYTRDADITLFCPIGDESTVIPKLAAFFRGRMDNAAEFALSHRIFLCKTTDGTPIDISLGALDFEHRCITRATDFDLGPGRYLHTCSAEDLIVLKAFADRGRDWLDIEGVLLRQGPKLNWPQILEELKPLAALKEAPELVNKLIALRDRLA